MTQYMETPMMLIICTKEVDTELVDIEKMEKMMKVITMSIVKIRKDREPIEKLKR